MLGLEPQIAQPAVEEVGRVERERRGCRIGGDISRPPQSLVALRAVGRHTQEVAALAPNGVLAAALEGLPITTAFTWTTTPGDDEPVRILRRHGYEQMADAVSGQVNGESRRRDSVYGTAAQMASCLKVRAIAQWVTPQGSFDPRPQFEPHAFVRSSDTLYSLSKEGRGTAGPLVTALAAATVEAAEEYATTQPGGRLQVPMLGVLDEAANVCRWHDLPDLYSHYGSRGIVLMTILQSSRR